MAARFRRPSLMGGLLWTCLGLAFLVHNFGIGPNLWSLLAHYWPILLILLGLGKVIDYYRQKDGVSLRVGEVVSILLLLFFGFFISRVSDSRVAEMFRDGSFRIGGVSVNPGQWMGTSYTYTQEASYQIAVNTPVRIENSFGLVSLVPGSDGEVRVRLKKVVYEKDEARAKDIANQVSLAAVPQGKAEATSFIIKTNRDELSGGDYRFNTDMEVFVPKKAQVQVRNSYGEVRAASLEGNLDLGTSHYLLDVRECSGEFTLSNKLGESRLVGLTGKIVLDTRGRVYLETIKGDVDVRNEYSDVQINDVDGRVTVSNTEGSIVLDKITKPVVVDARGTQVTARNLSDSLKITTSHRPVRITAVTANVSVTSQYARLSFRNIRGNVDVESNSDQIGLDEIGGYVKVNGKGTSVRANSVEGPVDVRTTLRDVVVNNFRDSCNISNEYADVTLMAAKLGKGAITVKDRNGDIELFVPPDAGFQIDATTRDGHVTSEIASLMPAEESTQMTVLKGKVKGGGPLVTLVNEYGNIRIRAQGTESARNNR